MIIEIFDSKENSLLKVDTLNPEDAIRLSLIGNYSNNKISKVILDMVEGKTLDDYSNAIENTEGIGTVLKQSIYLADGENSN